MSQLVEDPNVEIKDILSVISQDLSITSRILLVANSPFYGLSRRISQLSQAVMVLGFRNIRNIALSLGIFNLFDKIKKELIISPEEFWKHSLTVACISRAVAKLLSFKDPEESFTAGLLHDIGKIVFARLLFRKI